MAGPTYCSRLWCVMEIFTFMRMGGTRERIEVNTITHKDHTNPAAAKKELKKQFATFDAAKAECFLPEDKHRLLAVSRRASATSRCSTSVCAASSTTASRRPLPTYQP